MHSHLPFLGPEAGVLIFSVLCMLNPRLLKSARCCHFVAVWGFLVFSKIKVLLPYVLLEGEVENSPTAHVLKPALHDAILKIFFTGPIGNDIQFSSCFHS